MSKIHESEDSNIFAEIGVRNPQAAQLRSQLMRLATRIIKSRGFTQSQIASKLHLTQPQVSYLMNGKLSQFSVERLFEILNALHRDVRIDIETSKANQSGTTQIRELTHA